MDKNNLSEGDICSKFITPTSRGVDWDEISRVRETATFTNGWTIVRGKLVIHGQAKHLLCCKPDNPQTPIKASGNGHSAGDGRHACKDLTFEAGRIVVQDFRDDSNGKAAPYYLISMVHVEVEAIVEGLHRLLLALAVTRNEAHEQVPA